MKFVITNTMTIHANSAEEAKALGNSVHCNNLITQDSDTKILSVEEGIEDMDKIELYGYDGVRIITAIGHKIGTKYGQEYTVKSWDPENKTLGFEETEDKLDQSRISSGSYVYDDDDEY